MTHKIVIYCSADMQNRVLAYNPIELSTFQNENPMIDWSGVLNNLVPDEAIKPGPNTTIIIRVPAYYKGLNQLLSSNVTLQTLQEYFIINFVLDKVEFLDETSSAAFRAFDGKLSGGSTAAEERWRSCVTAASVYFKHNLARYYVLKKFGGEAERKKVDSFIETIHQEWIHQLDYVDWLDNQTKAAAIEKVKLLSPRAGYNINSPDLRDPVSIAKFNQGLDVNKTSFYDTLNILNEFYTLKSWQVVGKKLDENEWLLPAQTVNAYYDANRNQVTISLSSYLMFKFLRLTIIRLLFPQVFYKHRLILLTLQSI